MKNQVTCPMVPLIIPIFSFNPFSSSLVHVTSLWFFVASPLDHTRHHKLAGVFCGSQEEFEEAIKSMEEVTWWPLLETSSLWYPKSWKVWKIPFINGWWLAVPLWIGTPLIGVSRWYSCLLGRCLHFSGVVCEGGGQQRSSRSPHIVGATLHECAKLNWSLANDALPLETWWDEFPVGAVVASVHGTETRTHMALLKMAI